VLVVARGGERIAGRSRGVARHCRSYGRSDSGVPLDEPRKGKHRRDCRDENKSKNEELSKSRHSPPATGTGATSFGLVSGRSPVAATRHGIS
jgi:hypothetical protein